MHATGQDLFRARRSAGRAAIDYALPPRCPACGTIVGADRQFGLACWSSLHFLDGPACARCSIPLPTALPGVAVECGACMADAPPFDGAPAAVAYGPVARTVALRLKYGRSEEHTSELQSLMRISYAVFCLKKQNDYEQHNTKK